MGDPSVTLFQHSPDIIVRQYPSLADLFEALSMGQIQGAIASQIPAVNYVQGLFADQLKIASKPMTDAGLHLVALKDSRQAKAFSDALKYLKKKKKLQALLKKWQLT